MYDVHFPFLIQKSSLMKKILILLFTISYLSFNLYAQADKPIIKMGNDFSINLPTDIPLASSYTIDISALGFANPQDAKTISFQYAHYDIIEIIIIDKHMAVLKLNKAKASDWNHQKWQSYLNKVSDRFAKKNR